MFITIIILIFNVSFKQKKKSFCNKAVTLLARAQRRRHQGPGFDALIHDSVTRKAALLGM